MFLFQLHTPSIVEGSEASFTITRTGGDTTKNLSVIYQIIDVGEVTRQDGDNLTITFEANELTKTIKIKTDAHVTSVNTGSVTLKIKSVIDQPTVTYEVGSVFEQMVMVSASTKPVIEIGRLVNSATEDSALGAQFVVSLRHNVAGTYKFNYSVSQTGDFITDSVDTNNILRGEIAFSEQSNKSAKREFEYTVR